MALAADGGGIPTWYSDGQSFSVMQRIVFQLQLQPRSLNWFVSCAIVCTVGQPHTCLFVCTGSLPEVAAALLYRHVPGHNGSFTTCSLAEARG